MTDALRADEFDLMLSTLRYVLGAGQAPNGTTARDHYNAIINSIASRVERTQDADVRLACEIVKRAALAAPAVPPGWQLVPVEPTQAMCQEGQWKAQEWPKFPLRIAPIWKAMLAAAPTAQQEPKP